MDQTLTHDQELRSREQPAFAPAKDADGASKVTWAQLAWARDYK
ncbi:hypothetical protein [Immundisolibacter sp.]